MIALIFSVIISIYAANKITKPLKLVTELTEKLAGGDLTSIDINIDSKDETGLLADGVIKLANSLKEVLLKIKNITNLILISTEQFLMISHSMYSSVSEQKQQLGQISVSSNEINASLIDVSNNASKSLDSSKYALQTANNGKETIDNTIDKILGISTDINHVGEVLERLTDSSNNIGQILEVINNIAGQTNLLALNAAIEAARAGELGRGFAVVADEVRKLAENTTTSTKSINLLINELQQNTKNVKEVVTTTIIRTEGVVNKSKESKESLIQIVASSRTTTDMITIIATATEEQSRTITEIVTNINNAVSIADAVHSESSVLKDITNKYIDIVESLNEEVEKFKLGTDESMITLQGKGGEAYSSSAAPMPQ